MGIKQPQYGLAIEQWTWERKRDVHQWLTENFGAKHYRWGEQLDYGLENLWMDEDVFVAYLLRWGKK